MEHKKTLNRLSLGEKAKVCTLSATGSLRQRMLDLGIVPGASVMALHRSPSGDPTAYFIMGAVIALRHDDAREILVNN
ncbi:MAG: FeoA family protein [Anaerovorax sp.]